MRAYILWSDTCRFTRWRNRCKSNVRGIQKKATKRRMKKKKKKKKDTSTVPWSQGGGQSSFHANNKSCLPYRRCARSYLDSRIWRTVRARLPKTSNFNYRARKRLWDGIAALSMHRGINRSSLPAGGGAEDAYGASRCHGANKYGPIDRRVREKKKKKGATGGLTSVDRPARLTPAVHAGQ